MASFKHTQSENHYLAVLQSLHAMADAVKQLKIKTGSVGRLSKELFRYQEEELKEQKKVSDLKAGGADQHDIRHAVNCMMHIGVSNSEWKIVVEAVIT